MTDTPTSGRPNALDAPDFGMHSPLVGAPGVDAFAVVITRRSISPRGVARPAEVWRLAQEVAVQASSRAGWPPERYADAGVGFIVSDMTVEHFRELDYGERLRARTWIGAFRRGMLADREIRLTGGRGPLARISQRWVHVRRGDDNQIGLSRADDELVASLQPSSHPVPAATLPQVARPWQLGRGDHFELDVWHTWMDPYGHVNHPMYVDFFDEVLARCAVDVGIDPQGLFAVAERVRFRQAALAGDRLAVEVEAIGENAVGDVVFEGVVRRVQDGAVAAQATLVRGHHSHPHAWRGWWRGMG